MSLVSNVSVADLYSDPDAMISAANSGLLKVMSPSIALLALVSLLGVVGNTLVLLVTRQRGVRHPAQVYMVALALTDLVVCVAIVPYQIMSLSRVLVTDQYSAPVCKLFEWLKYGTVAASAGLLVAVALDRYIAICKPFFYKQIGPRTAVLLSVCAVLLGLLVLLMKAFLENMESFELRELLRRRVYLQQASGLQPDLVPETLNVYICHTSHPSTKLRYSFIVIMFILFLSCVIVPFICYTLVYKEVKRLKNFRKHHSTFAVHLISERTSTAFRQRTSSSGSVQFNQLVSNQSLARASDSSSESLHSLSSTRRRHNNKIHRIEDLAQKRASQQFRKQYAFAQIFLVVTTLFIVLWLPFWVINAIQTATDQFENDLHPIPAAIVFLVELLYFINNALNAFVYLGINSDFRKEALILLRRCCRRPVDRSAIRDSSYLSERTIHVPLSPNSCV